MFTGPFVENNCVNIMEYATPEETLAMRKLMAKNVLKRFALANAIASAMESDKAIGMKYSINLVVFHVTVQNIGSRKSFIKL